MYHLFFRSCPELNIHYKNIFVQALLPLFIRRILFSIKYFFFQCRNIICSCIINIDINNILVRLGISNSRIVQNYNIDMLLYFIIPCIFYYFALIPVVNKYPVFLYSDLIFYSFGFFSCTLWFICIYFRDIARIYDFYYCRLQICIGWSNLFYNIWAFALPFYFLFIEFICLYLVINFINPAEYTFTYRQIYVFVYLLLFAITHLKIFASCRRMILRIKNNMSARQRIVTHTVRILEIETQDLEHGPLHREPRQPDIIMLGEEYLKFLLMVCFLFVLAGIKRMYICALYSYPCVSDLVFSLGYNILYYYVFRQYLLCHV